MMSSTEIEIPVRPARKQEPRIPVPAFRVTTQDNGERVLQDMHPDLVSILQDHTNEESLYGNSPQVHVNQLFDSLGNLREATKHNKSRRLRTLINYLDEQFTQELGQAHDMFKQGVTNFASIKHLFPVGTCVYIPDDQIQGGVVHECNMYESMWGPYIQIEIRYVTSTGVQFQFTRADVTISAFTGVKSLQELPVRVLDDAVRAQLHVRGEKYAQVAVGAHHQHVVGHMQVQKWWNWSHMRATGRCMVDIQTHDQFTDGRGYRDRDNHNTMLTPDLYWQTDAYVKGFSFVTKQWGRFPVCNLQDVEFRKQAYDQLVMDVTQKVMIRSLVQHNHNNFEDIISGKGGGCIFLLHGEPGVGKTLTAEAVSELLERPLYSVSVGELGTDPVQLEKNLRQILDVSQIWNAVILLDEADIFLEKRSSGDILRNGMISIFLKTLEYHQGVMFLTTNRVNDFDPAFFSRISVALRYQALDATAREQVWHNLLTAAGISNVDSAALALHDLNGRQIKNIIRLSMSLSKETGQVIDQSLMESCVVMNQNFLNAASGS
jgi:hypothetical protein